MDRGVEAGDIGHQPPLCFCRPRPWRSTAGRSTSGADSESGGRNSGTAWKPCGRQTRLGTRVEKRQSSSPWFARSSSKRSRPSHPPRAFVKARRWEVSTRTGAGPSSCAASASSSATTRHRRASSTCGSMTRTHCGKPGRRATSIAYSPRCWRGRNRRLIGLRSWRRASAGRGRQSKGRHPPCDQGPNQQELRQVLETNTK